jgi:hypothetical protein
VFEGVQQTFFLNVADEAVDDVRVVGDTMDGLRKGLAAVSALIALYAHFNRDALVVDGTINEAACLRAYGVNQHPVTVGTGVGLFERDGFDNVFAGVGRYVEHLPV